MLKNPVASLASLHAVPDASNFHYERAEWVLFRSATTLPQKAGVPVGQLRRVVLKELVDNALDAGARVRVGRLEGEPDGYFVEDDGIGLDPQQVGRLFSISRPMISSKLRRLPTRGALGNGLRVVTGAVAASTGGSLRVLTRNRRLNLMPREDGGTDVAESIVAHSTGMRVEIVFGPEVPADPSATAWALAALRLNRGARYAGKSSPFWYDPDAFFELLNAAGDLPVRSLVAELDGCTGGKAGTIAAAFKGRACASLSRAEAGALLGAARDLARPVRPERLGAVGPLLDGMSHHAYAVERGTFRAGARTPLAVVPFVVEAWVSVGGNRTSTAARIALHINRSPVTGEVNLWREKSELCVYGCGLGRRLSLPKGVVDVAINILTPYCPITSDGKAPDLGGFEDAIVAAIERAGRKAGSGSHAPDRVSAKTVALEHLDAAVEKASGGGRYRFNQRQVFYVLRPLIREAIDAELSYGNFESIIGGYERERGDVPGMYRDPRGSLYHPHLGATIPLGTLAVEAYKRPSWTFNKLVYIEKEGFFEALKEAGWPERHDCALLTSKGFTTRAVKDLLDLLAGDGEPVRVFCVHDADAAGTMIYQTLVEGTRARPMRRAIEVVNLGLDPWEAVVMELEVEAVEQRSRAQPVAQYVADHEDGDGRPCDWSRWLQRHRVELNAMTTPQFVAWLDVKMAEHDGRKVVPPATIIEAEVRGRVAARLREAVMDRVLREARVDEQVEAAMGNIKLPDAGQLRAEVDSWLEANERGLWRGFADEFARGVLASRS